MGIFSLASYIAVCHHCHGRRRRRRRYHRLCRMIYKNKFSAPSGEWRQVVSERVKVATVMETLILIRDDTNGLFSFNYTVRHSH